MLFKNAFTILLFFAVITGSVVGSDSVKVYTQKAAVALKNSNYRQALENYAHVLRLDSTNMEAIRNSGVGPQIRQNG